jgi:hypothetical protein
MATSANPRISEGKQPDGGYGTAGDKNLYDDGRPYKSGNWHDVPEHSDIQHLVDFFASGGIEYWKMAPHNALVKSGTRVYALAEPGRQYLIYAAAGGSLSVDLAPGSYHIRRLDPRTGATDALPHVEGGATRSFSLPDGQDWVLWLDATPRTRERNKN